MEIYPRPDSKYWMCTFEVNGVRIRKSTKQTKRSAAMEAAMQMKRAMESPATPALEPAPVVITMPTLEEFAAQVFLPYIDNSQSLSFNSKRYYRNGVRLLRTTNYGTTPLDQVRDCDVDTLKTTGGPSNTNNMRRVIRLMLSLALEKEILAKKPVLHTLEENVRSSIYAVEMQEEMLEHGEQPLKDVAMTIFDAGMRPAEIVRIHESHFRWERGVLFVPGRSKEGHKSKKGRFVPVSDRMAAVYRERFKKSPNGWAYPSPRKKDSHISYFGVAKRFGELREKLGIPEDLVLYSARHTFGTTLMDETGNPSIVQEIMGHEHLGTTQKYVHPDKSGLREIINKRNRANAIKVNAMRAAREEAEKKGHGLGHGRPFLVAAEL